MTRQDCPVSWSRWIIPKRRLIMARYTCSFTVAASITHLRQALVEVLQACNLDIIYDISDYMMARENPGHVSFVKLVTVEVLIDKTTATETRINLVVKNEELPLQVSNHCHKMFELINHAIIDSDHWQLIESLAE